MEVNSLASIPVNYVVIVST